MKLSRRPSRNSAGVPTVPVTTVNLQTGETTVQTIPATDVLAWYMAQGTYAQNGAQR